MFGFCVIMENIRRDIMKKILICNQKGGVGKSLIADELAFSFERSHIPAAFLDLDGQGGTLHKTDQRRDAAAAVIDTPGALQKEMGIWMSEADVIVIPTRTTGRDIDPLLRMQEIAVRSAPKIPIVYVLNGWNRYRASADFKSWFEQEKTAESIILTLPQSEMIVQAGAAGISVIEYAKSSAAASAMFTVINEIRKAAGFPSEDEYKTSK